MGSVSTFADYKTKRDAGQRVRFTKNALTNTAGRLASLWPVAPLAGSAPTTAVAPVGGDAGDLGGGHVNPAGNLFIGGANVNLSGAGPAAGVIVVADRLSHQGGLDATVATEQTTNLPTAALTRYTDGKGVWAALEIYTQIGATSTTVAMKYTDQDGNTNITSESTAFGNTGFREAGRLILMPLALGDDGVRAVAGVTLAGTTGTAGNFGVTLLKPLLFIPCQAAAAIPEVLDGLIRGACQIPEVKANAHLMLFMMSNNAQVIQGELELFEA